MRPASLLLPAPLLFLALAAGAALADDSLLPPIRPWNGKSRELALPPDHPWATPFEKSGLTRTPRYDETVAWLRRLCEGARGLEMVSIGRSDEGRDLWMVVAGTDRARPTLLAQGGIHPGEVDGKDAGMMLLRDMTVLGTKADLLERANLLFIPILNVDGHERFGPHARVNQRGPVEAGWRTNSRNLNLNRDYGKLDTPELRAVARVVREREPDLYFDIHVTDGADYQYDITFGWNGGHAWSPRIAGWLAERLDRRLHADLVRMGHVPGPLVFAVDGADMNKGNAAPTFGARFSHGWGDLRHLPSVLVENHSLKPFDRRVLGTYVLLESALRELGESGAALREAAAKDRALRPAEVALSFRAPEGDAPRVPFLGIAQRVEHVPEIGADWVVFTGEPVTLDVPLLAETEPLLRARRPVAYWVPPAWREVIERLDAQGIRLERIAEAREVEVEMSRVKSFELAAPFEGRVGVKSAELATERRRERYPKGSVRVPTDQPLGDLAVHLLEPEGPDSFFRWGFFHEILQRTEYIENYAVVPLARRMLADPEVKRAYEAALAGDEALRNDPEARLRWFYERSPFADDRFGLYPVGREAAR
jgi:hypothetical protein